MNAEADRAPGFLWRLQDNSGNAIGLRAFEWDTAASAGVIVNLSTWASVEHLRDYVFSGDHGGRPTLAELLRARP